MEREYDDDTEGAQEVPGDVENAIGELFELLQDKVHATYILVFPP